MTGPNLISLRKYCSAHRSYYESLDGQTCPHCAEETVEHNGDLIRTLEERIAFAEQARDNAIKQRDDTLERSKTKAKSAGDRISALVGLMFVDKGTRDDAERQLTTILAKEDT